MSQFNLLWQIIPQYRSESINRKLYINQLLMVNYRKIFVFIITNLAFQTVGQLGIYSIIKHQFATQFGYDEATLGKFQSVSTLGDIVGAFFILFIAVTPSKGYLIYAFFNALFGLILFLPRHIDNIVIRDSLIYICFFFQQFFLASIAYTQIIFARKSIWYSLLFMGEIIAIIYAQAMTYTFKMKWQQTKIIWNIYVLIVAGLMYYFLHDGEVEKKLIEQVMNESQKSQVRQGIKQGENSNEDQKSKGCFYNLKLVFQKFAQLLKQTNVTLLLISFALVEGNYCVIMQWIPYYYTVTNNISYSLAAILAATISISIGPIILQPILYSLFGLERYQRKITYFLSLLSILGFIFTFFKYHQGPKIQIILFSVSHFLIGSPFSRVSTTQIMDEGQEDESRTESLFLLAHFLRNSTVAILSIVVGYLMESNSDYFWHVAIGTYVIWFIVESIRNLLHEAQVKQVSIQSS